MDETTNAPRKQYSILLGDIAANMLLWTIDAPDTIIEWIGIIKF